MEQTCSLSDRPNYLQDIASQLSSVFLFFSPLRERETENEEKEEERQKKAEMAPLRFELPWPGILMLNITCTRGTI
jgi:hypothetical protein